MTYPFKKPCPRCPYGIDGVSAVLCSVFAPRRRGVVVAGITTPPSGAATRATVKQDLPQSTVRRTATAPATFEMRRRQDSPPRCIPMAFRSTCVRHPLRSNSVCFQPTLAVNCLSWTSTLGIKNGTGNVQDSTEKLRNNTLKIRHIIICNLLKYRYLFINKSRDNHR